MATIVEVIDLIHPTASGVGVLLSDQIWVLFDREIDESVYQNNLVVTGPDFDTWSGPDLNTFYDYASAGSEEEILQSPSYHGLVQGTFSFVRVDLADPDTEVSTLDTAGSGLLYRSKAIFTPSEPLAANTEYTVYLAGDEDLTDSLSTGISTRTVYDPVADSGNISTAEPDFSGGYTGSNSDTYYVEITTSGVTGDARFKYWKASNPGTQIGPFRTRRGGTLLSNGVSVSFPEDTYPLGELWSCSVKPRDIFSSNLSWSFITGDGSYATIPASTATSVIGDVVESGTSSSTTSSTFSVSSTSPSDEASHQTIAEGEYDITVQFSSAIDPTTVASGVSVTVVTESVNGDSDIPASGVCVAEPVVSGSSMTITVASGYLLDNNLVTVTIDSTVASTGGVALGSDYEFWFTTEYTPFYCTLRKMQLQAGAYLTSVADDTINFSIFEASLAADAITWMDVSSPSDYYKYVRSHWTCCKAQEILLVNVLRGGDKLKSKQLGDLRVEYYQAPEDALDRALQCMEKLEPILQSGGAGVQKPVRVVKGELDPDRPPVGRIWAPTTNNQTPAANIRSRDISNRRYQSNYSRFRRGRGRYD